MSTSTRPFNQSTGLLTVTFTSLDPDNARHARQPRSVGFLPPDTNPPNGEGTINLLHPAQGRPNHRRDAKSSGEHRLRHPVRYRHAADRQPRSTPATRRAGSPRRLRAKPSTSPELYRLLDRAQGRLGQASVSYNVLLRLRRRRSLRSAAVRHQRQPRPRPTPRPGPATSLRFYRMSPPTTSGLIQPT